MSEQSSGEIGQLSLRDRVGGPVECDLCDAEPVTYDREWLGAGHWKHYLRCPECERETTMELRGAYAMHRMGGWEDRIKRKYVETEMSEDALDRSLNRLYESCNL